MVFQKDLCRRFAHEKNPTHGGIGFNENVALDRFASLATAHEVEHPQSGDHHQRIVFHFTPLHASWVNQIELLFGVYSHRVLRHASHSSIEHLRERTEAFMAQRNQAPKPFKSTFAGFELQIGEP